MPDKLHICRTFWDTRDQLHYDAISFANYHGLLRGVGDSRFAPQDSMTRAYPELDQQSRYCFTLFRIFQSI